MDGTPFLRTRFLLTQPSDLERLRATTVRQVWIDTSKGGMYRSK